MIDTAEFLRIVEAVRAAGYGDDITWSESLEPPDDADEFAREIIYVICNSGMKHTVAARIFNNVVAALDRGQSASTGFGHQGKADAIDRIWRDRVELLAAHDAAEDKVAWAVSLPWIGPITKYHVAKNFGADVVKPDIHLQRLADAEGATPEELCVRLARATGFRIATVDSVLWRACAIGIVNSRAMSPGTKRRTA